MKRSLIIAGIVVVVMLTALGLYVRLADKDENNEFADAKRGYFEISVEATGELVAENSADIKGPSLIGNRRFRAQPLRITDMVPEGTIVKAGDFVAEIDRSSFVNTLKDEQDALRVKQSALESKVLDSAVVLSQLRDEIRNQVFVASEAEITLAQSKFEPPATQRQAEIALDRARRSLEQKKKQYQLKRAQVRAEIMNLQAEANQQQRVVDDLGTVLASFTVRAPADGMVTYKRDRLGQKIKVGSNVHPWDPVVATLPDMSTMLTKLFISEIDIFKISTGLPVEISIDAFPDKYFTGTITNIANIGEQLPNSDSKVFEVLARLDYYDPALRPAMTTSNKIVVKTFNDVIYVPDESVHAGTDSVPYVYTKDGKKQIVMLGNANADHIIIEQGLEAGTTVWLTIPEKADRFVTAGLELVPAIRERERELARLEEERLQRYNTPELDMSSSGMGSEESEY